MDRRGFVTTGMAAGLVGATSAGSAIAALLENTPGWGPGKTLADGSVKLSSNENPLGLSPAARQAVIEAIPNANRYPSDFRAPLMSALSDFVGVKQENLVLGAGSTEILQMAVQAYQGPNTPLVTAEPTFEDVPRYMRPLAYNLVTVPLTGPGLAHDIGRMRQAEQVWSSSAIRTTRPRPSRTHGRSTTGSPTPLRPPCS